MTRQARTDKSFPAAGGQPAAAPEELAILGIGLPAWNRLLLVAGLVALVVLPFLVEGFTTFQMTQVAIYAIAILGLNLLTGYNGQFSLGHSAFFAVGAYTAAIAMNHFGLPYLLTLPLAAVISFLVGFAFGFPALRLEGLYLALATFMLAIAAPQLLKFSLFEPLTGGAQGLVLMRPEAPAFTGLDDDQWLYFISVIVMLALFWLSGNLIRYRIGRAIMAIRDNPLVASALGINTPLYKTVMFGISAAYTGVAGALSAMVVGFVAPDSFNFLLSVALLVGVVVGGIASMRGAIFGGFFILYIPTVAESFADVFSKGLSWAAYGVLLLAVIYVMPSGISGLIDAVIRRIAQPKQAPRRTDPAADVATAGPGPSNREKK
ncbi:MAG: branched-chain amino acid ABC transporter permease [Rhodobacteraceae bacterium]|jgi:branched-chain amino acid transport system permease protein|nr:branched-chain amino acid ABC transporter permease [Paracoccaceae bacterium]